MHHVHIQPLSRPVWSLHHQSAGAVNDEASPPACTWPHRHYLQPRLLHECRVLRLAVTIPAGAEASVGDIRAQCLGHAARLLHSQLAADVGGPASAPALDLAAALLAAGVDFAEDAECLATLRRHLPGLLKPLSMQTNDARCAHWLPMDI